MSTVAKQNSIAKRKDFLEPLIARYIHNSWAQATMLLFITLSICILLTPLFLKVIPQMVAQKDLLKIKQIHTK